MRLHYDLQLLYCGLGPDARGWLGWIIGNATPRVDRLRNVWYRLWIDGR
jgi:hypothetical protein